MNRLNASVLSLIVLVIAVGCAAPAAPASPAGTEVPSRYPLTVSDDRGKELTLAAPPARVVSLAPSATEIVFAIGAGERLVAVDDFSDYPAQAKSLPKVGGFRASPETIVSHRPDLILGITSGNLPAQLEAQGQTVFIFDPQDIEGVYRNILTVGRMLDRDRQAQKVVDDMRGRISAVAERARVAARKPRVLHEVDATDPARIYVAGPNNFIDSMITMAGGTNAAAAAPKKWPQLSLEEIVHQNPEIIVLGDAAYGTSPEQVMARPGWQAIDAVRNRQVFPISADIVSRPGPRLVQGFEAYARLVHPELFR